MRSIVGAAERGISKADQDTADLLSERDDLETIIRQYAQLYEIQLGEELRSTSQLFDLERSAARVRQMADQGSEIDGIVTDAWIMGKLDKLPRAGGAGKV